MITAEIFNNKINFSKFINELPEIVICINKHGTILTCNEIVKNKLGHTAQDLIGKNVTNIMFSREAEKHDEYITQYIHTGIKKILGVGRKVSAKDKNGNPVPLFLTVTELKIENEIYFIGLLRDLSEIEVSKSQLDLILETIPSIIIFTDTQKTIQFINHFPSGLQNENLLGCPISKIFSTEIDLMFFEKSFSHAQETGECTVFSYHYPMKNGKKIIFEATLKPIYNDKIFKGVIIVNNDITEKFQQQEKLKLLFKQKEDLLQEVYHRVKNNFIVIQSLLALSFHYENRLEVKEFITQLKGRIDALSTIHHLFFEIFENDQNRKYDLDSYINILFKQIKKIFHQNINFKAIPSRVFKCIDLDSNYLVAIGAILNELITNSYKHSSKEQPIQIYFGISTEEDWINIWYSDSGIYYQQDSSMHCISDPPNGLGSSIINSFSQNIKASIIKTSSAEWKKYIDQIPSDFPPCCYQLKFKES